MINRNFIGENLIELILIGTCVYIYKERPYVSGVNIRKYLVGIGVLCIMSIFANNIDTRSSLYRFLFHRNRFSLVTGIAVISAYLVYDT